VVEKSRHVLANNRIISAVSDGIFIQFILFISKRYFIFFILRIMILFLKCKQINEHNSAKLQQRFNTSNRICCGLESTIIMECTVA